ncbi:MAG: S8 family serine peptidase, partial [Acidobacteriota bacterium]|nr:S8 family serine peptidase [Acidobacteriota bacterium]
MRPFVLAVVVLLAGMVVPVFSGSEPQGSRIIVRARPGATATEVSQALQRSNAGTIEAIKPLLPQAVAPERSTERARRGLTDVHLVLVASDIPVERVVAELKKAAEVVDAEPDRVVQLQSTPDDPFFVSSGSWGQSYGDLWGLHIIDAESAWDLTTGSRAIVIAVIDSGLDLDHPDIQGNVWVNAGEIAGNGADDDGNGYVDDVNGWNFADGTSDVGDDHSHGHGTHVSGTIAANGNNALGVVGVMWQASIMSLKGFNAEGVGYESDLAAAIVYAAENGADVANNSWGREGPPSRLLRDVFAYARDLGVTSVVAAGNDGINVGSDAECFFSPACLDDVMTIAASNHQDERAIFSNYGTPISVAAPGGGTPDDPGVTLHPRFNILSLRARGAGFDELVVGESFYRLAGTSMAAPHAAGLAGLVLSRQPGIVPDLVQIVIEGSADDIGEPGRDVHAGFGRINAYEAVLLADAAASLPELAVSSLRLGKSRAPTGSPVPVEIAVANFGIPAGAVAVELFDGEASEGGTMLREWSVDLNAGETVVLETLISLEGVGDRSIVATIDPEDHVGEVTERNNEQRRTLVLSNAYFSETALTDDLADQTNPAISPTYVAYEDHREEDSDVVLYDIAHGETLRLHEDGMSLRAPFLWGRYIAWTACEGNSCRVVHHDLGRDGRFATPDDIGPTEISGRVHDVRTIVGSKNWVAWSDARFGNHDVFVFDLSASEERRITTNTRQDDFPELSGDWLFWERWRFASPAPYGQPNVVGLHLRTGASLELTDSDAFCGRPSMSGPWIVWEDWQTGNGEIYMYDFEAGEQRPLIVAPGDQRNPHLSGNEIVWEDERHGVREIYYLDLDLGEELRLTRDLVAQRNPAVSSGKIVWQEERDGDWDIFLATRESFPPPPVHLTASRSGGTVTLEWRDGGEG